MLANYLVKCSSCSREMPVGKLARHIATVHLNYHPYRCSDCEFVCHYSENEAIGMHNFSTGHTGRCWVKPRLEDAVHCIADESIKSVGQLLLKKEEAQPAIYIDNEEMTMGGEEFVPTIRSVKLEVEPPAKETLRSVNSEEEPPAKEIQHIPPCLIPPPTSLDALPAPPIRKLVKLWSSLRRKPGPPPKADAMQKTLAWRDRKKRAGAGAKDSKYRNYFEEAFEEFGDSYDGARIN